MAIKLPEVQTCCWYFSLRNGAKIFGFLSVLNCTLLALISGLEIFFVNIEPRENSETVYILISIDLVVQVIQATASVLLLLGVYQDKRQWVRPWLFTTIVSAFSEVYLCTSLFHFVNQYYPQECHEQRVLGTLLMLVDDVYGWLVVFSYYRTMTPVTSPAD